MAWEGAGALRAMQMVLREKQQKKRPTKKVECKDEGGPWPCVATGGLACARHGEAAPAEARARRTGWRAGDARA